MFSCWLLALGWFQLLEVTLRSYTHGPSMSGSQQGCLLSSRPARVCLLLLLKRLKGSTDWVRLTQDELHFDLLFN